MTLYSLYIVDDEKLAREGLSMALQKDYRVKAFKDAESVMAAIKNEQPDLVLLDIGLPGITGIDALSHIKQNYPDTIVIMITAYEDIESVVATMKIGAYDYILKPFQINALLMTINNALETISLRKEIQHLQEKALQENQPVILGESNAIQSIMEVVEKVARSADTPILITGETGTGKELIAKAIHYRSPNYKGPLITLNCAAIPKDLIESELFGHEKGAFTGAADRGKHGMVEKASGGTLFLDEVGDLSTEAQAKLLRFLENGEFYKVGGTQSHKIKTRIVSATNRDLSKMMATNHFRRDLYYRLAVINIKVPSLNERREDILPIAKYFLNAYNKKFGKAFTHFSPETASSLINFQYTGNVRELKNLIERYSLLLSGPEMNIPEITPQTAAEGANVTLSSERTCHLPPLIPEGIDFPKVMRNIEKTYMMNALTITNGNESQASRLLNLSRDQFRYRIKAYR